MVDSDMILLVLIFWIDKYFNRLVIYLDEVSELAYLWLDIKA